MAGHSHQSRRPIQFTRAADASTTLQNLNRFALVTITSERQFQLPVVLSLCLSIYLNQFLERHCCCYRRQCCCCCRGFSAKVGQCGTRCTRIGQVWPQNKHSVSFERGSLEERMDADSKWLSISRDLTFRALSLALFVEQPVRFIKFEWIAER